MQNFQLLSDCIEICSQTLCIGCGILAWAGVWVVSNSAADIWNRCSRILRTPLTALLNVGQSSCTQFARSKQSAMWVNLAHCAHPQIWRWGRCQTQAIWVKGQLWVWMDGSHLLGMMSTHSALVRLPFERVPFCALLPQGQCLLEHFHNSTQQKLLPWWLTMLQCGS